MTQIEAVNLVKHFDAITAVDHISLSVEPGEIVGLVGSDGAGKTTTLRLLVGALRPDEGSIHICGIDIRKNTDQARNKIGYLSQRFSLYEDLTVLENIRFFAEVRGINKDSWKPRCMELLRFVGLEDFATRKAGKLSGGMKQKLGLASALITQPEVLLLDEPTTGVDPSTRQDFWQLIIHIANSEHIAVLLTTPYMDEAARCQRLSFMRSGKIIAEGTPSQLRNSLIGRIVEIQYPNPLAILNKLTQVEGIEDARAFGDKIHLRCTGTVTSESLHQIETSLTEIEDANMLVRMISPTLEDVFISLSTDYISKENLHE